MKTTGLFSLILIVFVLSSCNSGERNAQGDTKENLKAMIEETKAQVDDAGTKNRDAHAERLANLYIEYAQKFPSDTLAPEMLFMAGNVCIGLEDFEKAIKLFGRIDKNYTDYLKRPEAIYLSGFVADYHQGKKGVAKTYYERVIELYPNHVFAKDARLAIDALHMTDEELLKKFQEQNKKQEEAI